MGYDVKFMERAIKLAKLGIGRVDPNPLVGAVVVKDGRVIGEGYHTGYGMPHAEREALNNLTEPAQGAEMYVTLEPCCHQGLQPPCTAAIIDAGIRTVYIGSTDPNPKVMGKGIWTLRHHGVEVVTGVMKKECDALNPVFFHYIKTGRPYVVLKYAMTLDGKIATKAGASRYVSGDFARGRVRAMRNQYPGIVVGIGTVLSDDPMLDTRRQKDRIPTRFVCDTQLQIPVDSKIVRSAGTIKTYVATGETAAKANEDKIRELEVEGVEVLRISEKDGHLDLFEMVEKIGQLGISGIMVEGGGKLSWGFLSEGLVNEVVTYIAPKIFGGADAITPIEGVGINEVEDAVQFHLVDSEILPGGDIYARYLIGPEPEEEEEGVEILAAEPHPIRQIKGQETLLLSVSDEETGEDQVTVTGDTEEEKPTEDKAEPAAGQTEATEAGAEDEDGDNGWNEADDIPMRSIDDLEEENEPKVELKSRIVTAVLSEDMNPFNIEEPSRTADQNKSE